MNTIMSPMSRGQGNELLNKLEAAGCDGPLAQRVINSPDNDLARRVVDFINKGGVVAPMNRVLALYMPTESQIRAREIMGKNYLGIEAANCLGARYTAEEIASLAEIPFKTSILKEYKNTHLLVAGFPMSIVDICANFQQGFFSSLVNDARFQKISVEEKVKVRWYLISKSAKQDSFFANFADQQTLLSATEEVPRACEVIYANMLFYLMTGQKPCKGYYTRCIDIDLYSNRICVGWNDDGEVEFNSARDERRFSNVGVASMLKLG